MQAAVVDAGLRPLVGTVQAEGGARHRTGRIVGGVLHVVTASRLALPHPADAVGPVDIVADPVED